MAGGPLTIEITGERELLAKLTKLVEDHERAAAAALYQGGLSIIADAIHRTPVDTGRLRATNYCAPPENVGGKMVVMLGFGTAYGIFVHERTDLHHETGEAKFLQHALDAAASTFVADLAARIQENVANGVGVSAISAGGIPTSLEEAGGRYEKHEARKAKATANRLSRSRLGGKK